MINIAEKLYKKRYEKLFKEIFIAGYLEGSETKLTSLLSLTEKKEK